MRFTVIILLLIGVVAIWLFAKSGFVLHIRKELGAGPEKWRYTATFPNSIRMRGYGSPSGPVYSEVSMSAAQVPVRVEIDGVTLLLGKPIAKDSWEFIRQLGEWDPGKEEESLSWRVSCRSYSIITEFNSRSVLNWLSIAYFDPESRAWDPPLKNIRLFVNQQEIVLPLRQDELPVDLLGKPTISSRFHPGP